MHKIGEQIPSLNIDNDIIIEELINARDTLRKMDQKFYKIFDLNPCPMAIGMLETGQLIDVNDAFLKISGFKKKTDLIGKITTEEDLGIIRKQDRQRIIDMLNSGDEVKNIFVKFKNIHGKKLIGLFTASIIELNDKKCLLTICQIVKKKCFWNFFF